MHKATAFPAAGERPSGRLRALLEFRYLALLSVLGTYSLIVLGGTVRATGSGTACPDWPLCHGRVVPPLETNVLIEFSHRLLASLVGLLILATILLIWRKHRDNRLVFRAGVAAGVLLAVQVLLGGVTVGTETNATVVALHLSVALTLLAALILVAAAAFRLPAGAASAGKRPPELRHYLLPLATALATFALIITGAYVSQTGAGLAYPDWPLFNHKLVSAGGRLADLHYAHRLVAALAGAVLAALVVRTLRHERDRTVIAAVAFAFVLYVAQVFAGAANVWLELPTSLRIVHLALASALWAVIVFSMAWRFLGNLTPAGATA
ncbi:MAG: COX15/CtaA family protein [Dehalococcoidia bacterium]|nr:COX15/CtaA family protein [Dehalococcoidia bacterium]